MKPPQRVNPYDQKVKDYLSSKTFRYIATLIVLSVVVPFICGCMMLCLLPSFTSFLNNLFR